jgi:flagellar motor switch protein FliG
MAKAARRLAEGEMSGLQKASVLMLALGEEQAGSYCSPRPGERVAGSFG